MATKVRKVGYFYFEVKDEAGAGARVLGKLKDAGVNLLSFVAFPTGADRAQITVVPENADTFASAAKGAGLTPSARKECFLVQGDDRVGAAHEVLNRLAEAKISFTAGSGSSGGAGSFGMTLFVKPSDVAAAAKALSA
jgi:prephenate dehydratase